MLAYAVLLALVSAAPAKTTQARCDELLGRLFKAGAQVEKSDAFASHLATDDCVQVRGPLRVAATIAGCGDPFENPRPTRTCAAIFAAMDKHRRAAQTTEVYAALLDSAAYLAVMQVHEEALLQGCWNASERTEWAQSVVCHDAW